MKQLLLAAAEEGVLGPDEITEYAGRKGIAKSTAAQARGIARRQAEPPPESVAKKAQSAAANKVVGAAVKAARQSVIQSLALSESNAVQLAYLRGKRDAGGFAGAGNGAAGGEDAGGNNGGGGDGGNTGGGGDTGGGSESATPDDPKASAQKVRDENRQHRDENYAYRKSQQNEDRQKRDESAAIRQERRRKEAHAREEAKHKKFAEDTYKRAVSEHGDPNDPNGPNNPKKPKKNGIEHDAFSLLKGQILIDQFATAFRSGLQVGNAVGAVAQGLSRVVVGAASAFVSAGQAALGLFLSPFGKTGGAAANMAGALGHTLVAALSAGGGILAAGAKIGVGLVAGMAGVVAAGAGAALGAVIGTALGLGPLTGAVLGASIVAKVGQVITGVLSTIGGAVGSALGAIGSAFGQLGGAVGTFLGNIQSVLSDLIETGVRLSVTSLQTQRNSGMSGAASSQATALSQVLTGGGGAFTAMFSNVAMQSPYMRSRNRSFGADTSRSFVDNLPSLYRVYKGLGDSDTGVLERTRMLSIVAPGAQDVIGNLFSLGGGAVNKAVQAAKATALSPQENMQNAMLGLDLNVVQANLDRLKTRLLSDLMPAIQATLGVFTTWFTGHEGQIVSGLESIGRWLYVMLPEYIREGVNAFFELGKSLGSNLPAIADFGKGVAQSFAYIFNAIRVGIGTMMMVVGGALSIIPGPASVFGANVAEAGGKMLASGYLDPHKADKFFDNLGKKGSGIYKSSNDNEWSFDQQFEKNEGSIKQRNQAFDQYMKNSQAGAAGSRDLTLKADITVHPDKDSFHRFELRVGDQTIKRIVRADQRS